MAFAGAFPDGTINLLFIHHSVGGQWLADPGPQKGEHADVCIYEAHPNGGGLRARLREQGYVIHEASYRSQIGQDTGLFDWLPKFRDQMQRVLACDHQDASYTNGRRNQVVMFKSCFPNNWFVGPGEPPGNPGGPDLTLANAQAAYTALLNEFTRYSDVLFVCVTAPPIASKLTPEPLWRVLARAALGRLSRAERVAASAKLARRFNDWLKAPEGWLKDYTHRNVVVFDYYDVLTDEGASDLLAYPTGDGCDSHPSREGQQRATAALVPILNRAVRQAGVAS